jgi:hypothetical protein
MRRVSMITSALAALLRSRYSSDRGGDRAGEPFADEVVTPEHPMDPDAAHPFHNP